MLPINEQNRQNADAYIQVEGNLSCGCSFLPPKDKKGLSMTSLRFTVPKQHCAYGMNNTQH